MSGSRGKSASQRANKPLDIVPRPAGNLFTIRAISMLVHRSEKTIRNLLSMRADLFDEPVYEKVYAPRDQRLYRVITESDMLVVRSLFPVYRNVYVKRKRKARP